MNPPTEGASALAPRLVTPQSLTGIGDREAAAPPVSSANPLDALVLDQGLPPVSPATDFMVQELPSPQAPNPEPPAASAKLSDDDAWRREVLERVRKRRQARAHALPLFGEGSSTRSAIETPEPAPKPLEVFAEAPPVVAAAPPVVAAPAVSTYSPYVEEIIEEQLEPAIPDDFAPVVAAPIASLKDVIVSPPPTREPVRAESPLLDFSLRAVEAEPSASSRPRALDAPSQSLVERSRPTLTPVGGRSLVADLPLVEPSKAAMVQADSEPQLAPVRSVSRVASMNDRAQAALIDLGIWSAMSAMAFYFASRIARTSVFGLAPAWRGMALFGIVLAAAYILFFGGLSGATPGKIACGIQVRRLDGQSLGPLGALARGVLGLFGIALFGMGLWPAFWDKDRRALHDRATDARVMLT